MTGFKDGIDVLLVEDNPGDARLVFEAFREGRIVNRLHHVADGQAAMDWVQRCGEHTDAPRPDLILLDLNLPRKHGKEVLAELKSDPGLREIPVIALTTSDADHDVRDCYAAGANAYIVKPVELDRFLDAMKMLEEFWLCIVKLPPGGGA